MLDRARRLVGANAFITPVDDPRSTRSSATRWPIVVIPLTGDAPDAIATAVGGRAAGEAIERAVRLVSDRHADAIAVAPSNKNALHQAGYAFEDHTAMLGHLTGSPDTLLMPMSGSFRIASVTNHVSLAAACALVTTEAIARAIRNTATTLRQLGIARPRIAVAALNPHNGENGDMGDEEITRIAPAVATVRGEGIDAEGPFAADTLFTPAKRERYDAFVTMFHDQGRIPLKAVAFGSVVNITAGLPFFFASVGHGTAYDIAWQGRADAGNLIETVRHASRAAAARAAADD